ncbi:hypothetical protein FHK94_17090 [Cylindrospermopsis raciborskii CS-506_D]|uniref:hypothetical protein n=1 Tax=Cylindrospermopsis raciborskii TaxID=77022 RepID=UPI0015A6A45A|nr:hypothetical protein [Cylindrospermopsis raciborskii]MBA4451058.1 hypothetical protein [Cylindrospermopsis raciborskii CS-506_D]
MLKTVIFSFREHDYQQYTKCDLSQGVQCDRLSSCSVFSIEKEVETIPTSDRPVDILKALK